MSTSSKKFAVFDIDGTLYRGNLTWDFFNQLIRRDLIPTTALEELEAYYIAHDNRENDNAYSEYDKNLIGVFCSSLTTIADMDTYWAIGKQVAERNAGRLYKYTRELLNEFKSKGYTLIAVTNSVGAVAKPFAFALGFNIVATNEEILDTTSGQIVDWSIYVDGATKGETLATLIKNHQLSLLDSYAVGDTKADALMLEIVENPVAFNPERELQQIAIDHKWPIVVERKNVIYRLEEADNTFVLAEV